MSDDSSRPTQPYDLPAIDAMVAQVWQYLEYSSTLIHGMHKALEQADPVAAARYAGTHHAVMSRYPGADLALGGLSRAARLTATATYVDPSRWEAVDASFDRLRETMHGIFWAAPGEFWDSPDGIRTAMHYDRALAEAQFAIEALTKPVHAMNEPRSGTPDRVSAP